MDGHTHQSKVVQVVLVDLKRAWFFKTSLLGNKICVKASPVRYAKFESIRYFIDIDILQNCLITRCHKGV